MTEEKNLHIKGAKDDSTKPRLDLVLGDFKKAIWDVGLVGTFGAKKYTDRGWKEVNNGIERYLSAMLRHYFKFKNGEKLDSESGLSHLSHMAWNALAVLELYHEIRSARAIEPGSIYEVAVDHSDFRPILKQDLPIHTQLCVDEDCNSKCTYKYDCIYKE